MQQSGTKGIPEGGQSVRKRQKDLKANPNAKGPPQWALDDSENSYFDKSPSSRRYKKINKGGDPELDKARKAGVSGFYKGEKERIKRGEPTKQLWTWKQKKAILKPKTPKYYTNIGKPLTDENGKLKSYPFEGHHKTNVNNPKFDKDRKAKIENAQNSGNIEALTYSQHYDAHGGNWKNPTDGESHYQNMKSLPFDGKLVSIGSKNYPLATIKNLSIEDLENMSEINR